ncbi:MAG: hypothetical protein HYZ28_12690 [Myxococcales bacterium]|nr:hypothetical protein [Myxococcales bacterium]
MLRRALVVLIALVAAAGCKKEGAPSAGGTGATSAGKAQDAPGAQPDQGGGAPQPAAKAPEGCNSDFSQPISSTTTLTAKCSPYTIASQLSVEGWDLTIEPGVTVQMGDGATLSVGYNQSGRLLARGTAEAPIRFISAGRKEPGAWRGIHLYANADKSVLEHVVIEHAGKSEEAALRVDADAVEVRSLKAAGIEGAVLEQKVSGKQRLGAFAGNDLSQAGSKEEILLIDVASAPAISADNKFPPKKVVALSGQVTGDVTLKDVGVPFRASKGLEIEGTDAKSAGLTIEPGVALQFGEGSGLSVGYNNPGALKAVGTAEKPIVLTRYGDDPKGSPWSGIHFYANARAPQLEHVRIEYAGERDGAAVRYHPKGLGKLSHCTVAHGKGFGVKVESSTERFELFDHNSFEDLAQAPLVMPAELADKLGANNRFPAGSFVELTGDVHRDTTLAALAAPYYWSSGSTVESHDPGKTVTLTLEPGTTVKFGAGSLTISYNGAGALKAVGEPKKPVLLTALEEHWRGIDLGQASKTSLENVVIEKVHEDEPGIRAHDQAQGSIKRVTFRDMKVGLRKCGSKLSAEGLKFESVPEGQTSDGC